MRLSHRKTGVLRPTDYAVRYGASLEHVFSTLAIQQGMAPTRPRRGGRAAVQGNLCQSAEAEIWEYMQ